MNYQVYQEDVEATQFRLHITFTTYFGDSEFLIKNDSDFGYELIDEVDQWFHQQKTLLEKCYFMEGVGFIFSCDVETLIRIWLKWGHRDNRYRVQEDGKISFPLFWFGPDNRHHLPDPRRFR